MNSSSFRSALHRSLFLLLGVLALVLISSCETSNGGSRLERDPQAFGWRMGREDALAGRSENHERHLYRLSPSADAEDYEDAYDDAYSDAEDEVQRRGEAREEAIEAAAERNFNAGYQAGEADRDRGLSRNPNRHGTSLSNRWIEGYMAGWNER